MSTVGFGDVLCETVMGKVIIMIFICIGLVGITIGQLDLYKTFLLLAPLQLQS